MDKIEVPEVLELPKIGPNEESAVAFADLVLTTLFRHRNALLHAEYKNAETSVTWFITPRNAGTVQQDELIAISPSLGSFRSVLARFGHHYMDGQLYHGFTMRPLQQNGKIYRCLIYISNMGQSGFWIRVYSATE
ncbi:MAG: hypothetical protein WDM80_00685 [Limisphaerales bacterium]